MTRTISTNDNAMMMNFRDVMISNDMRWNFADEMTAILDKMNSKDGAALANYTIHAKAGKVTKINDSIVKQSVTVKMLMPYAMEEGKRRFEVIIENGEVSPSSAGNILSYVLEKMFEMQNQFNDIKRFGADSMGVQMDMDLYPMLKNIYETYGVEEMDRRFAEFSDYLISLGAVDPMLEEIVDEAVKEQMKGFDNCAAGEDVDSGFGDDYMVKNDTPKLDNEDADVVKNDTPRLDVDDVYGVVEQLCTDMEEQMIECGNFMVGYKYAEPDCQGRPAEWFEDMIFVTKKSDLDEDGDYVWDDCEEFRIGDYFTYVVELLRGDFDVIAEITNAVVEYMGNNRDLTPALASEDIEEIVENALESAMDDGEEYYDDIICQVGNWYVNYTSPCDEFPNGCVCVVDEDGRLYGNWCDVADSYIAVDYLVETIEKCNKMFNNVA